MGNSADIGHVVPGLHQALIACTVDVYTVLAADGRVVYQSPSVTDLTGWTPEEMQGADGLAYLHPDDCGRVVQTLAPLVKGDQDQVRLSVRVRTKAGGWVHLDSVVRNELKNPDIRGLVIVSRDKTSDVEAQRRLEEREHLLRTVEGHPCLLLWALDKDGIITVSQGAGLRVLGLEPGQVVGANVFDLYADNPQVLSYLRRALAGETLDYTIEIPSPTGSCTMDNRLRPQLSDNGEVLGVTAIAFDVSDREELESELRRAKTMEAIGLLAGGIAHDFNNLLTAIVGFAAAAKRSREAVQDDYLDQVIEAGQRGGELVGQLLSFARKDEIRPEPVVLSALLERSRALYAQVLGDDIAIDIDISNRDMCVIDIDKSKLEQVFLNLVANARDAMPGGGSLRIRLRHEDSSGSDLCVCAEVEDTGEGMAPEAIDCAFDPFYSTKERGTGLGLATTHGIVTRAGGQISVESTQGVGTTFLLRFPCSGAAAAHPPSEAAKVPESRARAPGRLLLIDDNDAVLNATALTLEFLGYDVRTAESGQAGYDLFVAHQGDLDLVISDMTMPGMKGDELAVRIREVDQTVPILCVSGNHEPSMLIDKLDGVSTLNKPYVGDELHETIERLLARRAKSFE